MAQDDAEYLSAGEFAADYFTLPRLADVTIDLVGYRPLFRFTLRPDGTVEVWEAKPNAD